MAAQKLFMKQPAMQRMVFALVPILISAIYFFGWRVLAILAVTCLAGLVTEYLTSRSRGQPISMANFVTCWLLALSLPPTVPYFVAVVGAVVAVLFGKEVFGGFGRNFANPAIVGRLFVYICFPVAMTGRFVPAFRDWPGGLVHWSFESLRELPAQLAQTGMTVSNAVSQASPAFVQREYGEAVVQQAVSWWNLLLGDLSGTFTTSDGVRILSAGSMGEGCALLILLAAAFLLITKTANWRLMFGCLLGFLAANVLFRHVLGFDGLGEVASLEFNLFAGSTLYVMVFMVTEPVSAPKKNLAIWAYALIIGFLIVTLRWLGVFVAAASFALLLGNIIGPLLDIGAEQWELRRKLRAAREGQS